MLDLSNSDKLSTPTEKNVPDRKFPNVSFKNKWHEHRSDFWPKLGRNCHSAGNGEADVCYNYSRSGLRRRSCSTWLRYYASSALSKPWGILP